MKTRFATQSLAAISLTALGFAAIPSSALAQDAGARNADTVSNDQLDKPINLDVRSANLFAALTLLFDQLKVGNYTLPEALKQREVSAHFTNLPLRTALETLLKNSGYTYRVEGGVYSVVPKIERLDDGPIDTPLPTDAALKSKRIYRVASSQLIYNAVDITTRLGGKVLPGAVGSQSGAGTGSRTGGFGSGAFGSGLSGGVGSFGSGSGGSGLVGGLNDQSGIGQGAGNSGNGRNRSGGGRGPGGF